MPRLLLLLLACFALVSGARSQTCSTSWAAAVDGDWTDASKWTDGQPEAGEDVCITVDGTYTVTIPPSYRFNISLGTFTLGATSGTQTLVSGGALILTDITIGENAVAEFIAGTSGQAFSGLTASGTVLVEGIMDVNHNSLRGFVGQDGTLDVAPSGILRASGGARLGGPTSLYRIRGTAELFDGGSIYAPVEIFGGTVRATEGEGFLFNEGGVMSGATLDAASGATLVISGNYVLEGTISGAPEGEVGFATGTLTAAASGATLNVTGQGVRLGTGVQRQTVLTGGPILNTGRLVFEPNNFFATIQGTTFTNEGTFEAPGNVGMSEGAALRNRPSGVITMAGTQFYQSPNTGVVRLVNEGLLVRLDDGNPNEVSTRFLGVTLESLPGSEIRVLDNYVDFSAGPNDDTLPPGTMLTGKGTLRLVGLPIRSTFSPGTEANPIGALGPRNQDAFVLAPEAITILDIAAGGASDVIARGAGFGSTMILGGTLRVRAVPAFTPAIGDSWTIAENLGRPIQAEFVAVETDGIPAGLTFVVDTSVQGTATLRAVASTSVSVPLASAQEGTPLAFVLTHPSLPEPFTINVETGGTATLFADYTLSATRGFVRALPNTTQTTVQVFPRRDADTFEGDETVTLRVVEGMEAAPGSAPEASVTITDGPASTALSVSGIAPVVGANVGLVTAILYGTAFTDDLDVRLVGPATVEGTAIAAFPQAGGLRVTFDLRDQPAGIYDVVVTGSGTATLAGGFGVIAAGEELPIWATINGTSAPRVGRRSTYTVTVGNDGPVDIFDTLIDLLVTGADEYSIKQTSELIGAEGEPDGVRIGDQDIVPVYVYKIPAGGHVQFSMRVVPSQAGQPLGVAYQLHRPNPKAAFTTSGDFDDFASDAGSGQTTHWGLMGAYMNEFLTEGATLAASKTGAFVGDDEICLPVPEDSDDWDVRDLLNHPDAEAMVETLRAAGVEAFTDGSVITHPDGSAGVSGHELVHHIIQIGGEINPQASPQRIEAAAQRTVRNMLHDAANQPHTNNRGAGLAPSSSTVFGGLLGITGNCSGGITRASFDPNDKLGPFGVGDARFVRSSRADVPYTIRFENLSTASAPAQEVVVVDTLDTAVFDLSTFGFGPISWGENRRLTPPMGSKTFEAEVDLSPEINARLLVTAALDEATGRVEWHFVTLDPSTNDLPEDGTIGFLPPNVMSPDGEGAVQFLVKTHEGLASGTEITNEAEIIFDVNEPIFTPIWSNTIDDIAPASSVQPLAGTETNPVTLTLNGSDAGSGIAATLVYASQDGGPFRAVGISEDGTFAFEGEDGSTYGFYSIAYDRVDNLEGPKTAAEATTMIAVAGEESPTGPLALTLEAPRPNPARGLVRLRFGLPSAGAASVRVLDALGREVSVLSSGEAAAGWHTAEWQPRVASGVYVVELRSGDEVQHQRLTVVR